MKKTLLPFFAVVIFSSCYTYRIFPKEYRKFEYNGKKDVVFIVNPELKKEYVILMSSGIFRITNDSLDVLALRIKLYPLKKSFACGQPITASLLTLGQVPVYLPDRYQFEFAEIRSHEEIHRQFELRIATRFWFWDMFSRKNFNQKAGQFLLADYYMKQKIYSLTDLRKQD
jgi:hypothetical protein